MSDDTNGYNKGIQLSTTIHGDLFNLRAKDGAEFEELLVSVAEHADKTSEALANVKSAYVARGVFTGTASTNTPGSSSGSSAPSRSASTSGGPPGDSAPRCAHGAMKDLSNPDGSLKYKKRFYCPAPRGQQQCPAQD